MHNSDELSSTLQINGSHHVNIISVTLEKTAFDWK